MNKDETLKPGTVIPHPYIPDRWTYYYYKGSRIIYDCDKNPTRSFERAAEAKQHMRAHIARD